MIDRRTLFWNLCNMSMLELLAVPHRGMPYVHNARTYEYQIDILFQWPVYSANIHLSTKRVRLVDKQTLASPSAYNKTNEMH